MTWKDRFIAWFLVIQGLAGLAITGWLASHYRAPFWALSLFIPVAVAATTAGIASLLGKRWGSWLGIIVFAIQTPIIALPYFQFSLWIGLHLDLAFTWAGRIRLGVNVVGLVMLVWAVARRRASGHPPRQMEPVAETELGHEG